MILNLLAQRVALSLTTIPSSAACWWQISGITLATTISAGLVATTTGFVNPLQDWDPPPSAHPRHVMKALSVLVFPSLFEEMLWRGALVPHPSMMVGTPSTFPWTACGALVLHVVFHPFAAWTVWPRGKNVFTDYRFLVLATIVLGGATLSYLASGGSAWAAAITHGIPVALWRDFFGGEAKLGLDFKHGGGNGTGTNNARKNDHAEERRRFA